MGTTSRASSALSATVFVAAPAQAPSELDRETPSNKPPLVWDGRRAKTLKLTPGKHIFKSKSTPHLRSPNMSDSEDKKRNKLGYQRISVACAHCRRRKIRCLVPDDETEGRCQNCIRLKKDCVFYPVDQQAAIDAKSEASSRTGAPSASSTGASSPSRAGSMAYEARSHQLGDRLPNIPTEGQMFYPRLSITHGDGAQLQGPDGFVERRHSYFMGREQPLGTSHPMPGASWAHGGLGTSSQVMSIDDSTPFPSAPRVVQQQHEHVQGLVYGTDLDWSQQQQQTQTPARSLSYPDAYNNSHGYSMLMQMQPHQPSYVRTPSRQPFYTDPRLYTAPIHPNVANGQPSPRLIAPDHRSASIATMPSYPHTVPLQFYTNAAHPQDLANEGVPHTLPSQPPEQNGYPE